MVMSNTQARVYNAPEPITSILGRSVFLAGSIADDWHAKIIRQLEHLPITIFNPLRTDWDETWTERKSDARFYTQVRWELDAQERADVVAMYLHPEVPSTISLLELGLSSRTGKMVVCCPDGFDRKGNVEVLCERYSIPLVDSFEELVHRVIERIRT
ncbi:hypothetical protein LXA43DRAFT_1001028 [Ganoderma leucocontextum]|nr:hypothetical protein LXA43DRAFT_1001028 [Ganoderma leucocontextum]